MKVAGKLWAVVTPVAAVPELRAWHVESVHDDETEARLKAHRMANAKAVRARIEFDAPKWNQAGRAAGAGVGACSEAARSGNNDPSSATREEEP